MQQLEVINILKKDLNFSDKSIEKLKKFIHLVLRENKNYNFGWVNSSIFLALIQPISLHKSIKMNS